MTIKKTLSAILAATALTAVALPALAAEPTVRELSVTASSTDARDSNALQYYPEITGDLTAAIFERITLDPNPDGYNIDIQLGNISIDGDTALADSREFNQMEGVIKISTVNNSPDYSYPVKIIAQSGEAAVPEGFIPVNPSTDDFYVAMINGFAEAVEARLPEAMSLAASSR